MSDYDKQEWQAEQAVRDAALEKQREKERKARERSACNARRKLERLHRTLSEKNAISDFEDEFGESVVERLDKFGSAFHSLEKGRPGDALSFAQKRVVAAMNKKVKDLKKPPRSKADVAQEGGAREDGARDIERPKPRSSFKSKRKSTFTPRVRRIEDDMPFEASETMMPAIPKKAIKAEPYIPAYQPAPPQRVPMSVQAPTQDVIATPAQGPAKRPFLRLVKHS